MTRNPHRLSDDFGEKLGLQDSPINKTESARTSKTLFKSFAAEKDDGEIEILD